MPRGGGGGREPGPGNRGAVRPAARGHSVVTDHPGAERCRRPVLAGRGSATGAAPARPALPRSHSGGCPTASSSARRLPPLPPNDCGMPPSSSRTAPKAAADERHGKTPGGRLRKPGGSARRPIATASWTSTGQPLTLGRIPSQWPAGTPKPKPDAQVPSAQARHSGDEPRRDRIRRQRPTRHDGSATPARPARQRSNRSRASGSLTTQARARLSRLWSMSRRPSAHQPPTVRSHGCPRSCRRLAAGRLAAWLRQSVTADLRSHRHRHRRPWRRPSAFITFALLQGSDLGAAGPGAAGVSPVT